VLISFAVVYFFLVVLSTPVIWLPILVSNDIN